MVRFKVGSRPSATAGPQQEWPENSSAIELETTQNQNSRRRRSKKVTYTDRLSFDTPRRQEPSDSHSMASLSRWNSILEESAYDFSNDPSKTERTLKAMNKLRLCLDAKVSRYSSYTDEILGYATKPMRAVKAWWKRRKLLPPSKNGRHVTLRIGRNLPELIDDRTTKPFRNNIVTSGIYTIYDFVPRQLLYQFSKLANVYFLFVSILQMIPSWSTTGNYTTIVPLCVFIMIAIARDGYDDFRRHRSDKIENNRKTIVCRESSEKPDELDYIETEWKHVKVGDVVRVMQNEWFPADVVLLHSSGPKGIVYVETVALDGETNLKVKETAADLQETFRADTLASVQDAVCITEDPNLDLYNFEGSFCLGTSKVPLSNDNVVYRGCMLRNTTSCFGLVIFTGQETKVQLNSSENSRQKAPKLQTQVNKIVLLMVAYVLLLAGFSSLASSEIQKRRGDKYWYLKDLHVNMTQNVMGFIIMLNTLIPLSLYVSMEICKVFQMLHIQSDVDMYDIEHDVPCSCQTSTLNEELGQVSYIFSDKTGTLTDNVMLFRKLSVGGRAWLHDLDLYFENEEQGHSEEESDAGNTGTTDTNNGSKNKKGYLFQKAKHSSIIEINSMSPSRKHTIPDKNGGSKGASVFVKTVSATHDSKGRGRPSVDILNQVAALPRKSFGVRISNAGRPSMAPTSRFGNPRPSMAPSTNDPQWHSSANPRKPQDEPSTLQLLEYLLAHPNTVYGQRAKLFLLAMALCHSASPEIDLAAEADGTLEIENLGYQAASPDELALVSAARDLGHLVIDRQYNSITIRTYPNGFENPPLDEVYRILDVIEFTSTRKRMSTIIKFPDGRICLFVKGADNVMIERLKKSLLGTAHAKIQDLQSEAVLRRGAEADLANEQSKLTTAPLSPRESMSLPPAHSLVNLEDHFSRANAGLAIQESGRKSIQLRRQSMERSRSIDASKARQLMSPEKLSFKEVGPDKRISITTLLDVENDAETLRNEPTSEARADNNEVDNDEGDLSQPQDEKEILEKTLEHIDEFSTEGLRTLLYGHRFLSASEYEKWKADYDEARSSLENRQAKIDSVGSRIEVDLNVTGATAIEDKLQKGVPEAIDKLRRANIRMWMLTGDKRETAINIGYSCRLIKDYSTLVVLKEGQDLTSKILAALEEFEQEQLAHTVIVIDGFTFASLENDSVLMSLFVDLGLKADSVIVCRASPAQKAVVVQSVRSKCPEKVMLAIGDGANDVAMIQSADLGIGIAGREGLQAARSSDYSIGQFRFLLKLLLVHGRWNYVRTCKYILGTFYKEFMFYMGQVIYQRNTMFTGTSLYESWSISMFNTLFTSLPVIFLGVLDQDLTPETLIAVPELYSIGQRNQMFGYTIFVRWLIMAMLQCVMACFLTFEFYGKNYGIRDTTLYPLGVVVYSSIVLIISIKLQFLETHNITLFNHLSMFISGMGYFLWNLFLGGLFATHRTKTYYVPYSFQKEISHELCYWATVLIICSIGSLWELLVKMTKILLFPTDVDAFQLLEKEPHIVERLEKECALELSHGWEYQESLDTSWFAIFRGKWPGHTRRRMYNHKTSRRRRRDKLAATLFGRRKRDYDKEIQEILEMRERELNLSLDGV